MNKNKRIAREYLNFVIGVIASGLMRIINLDQILRVGVILVIIVIWLAGIDKILPVDKEEK